MLFNLDNTSYIFELLEDCRGHMQSPEHHPEGDVFIHSLQVCHFAMKESNDIDLLLGALLHDIGKKIALHGHEVEAIKLLNDYASAKTLWLIEHHMRFWYYILGDMRKLGKCKSLADHPWTCDLLQLARWDKMGRIKDWIPMYSREIIIERLNNKIEGRYIKNENTD